jgi:hypothetical protein
MTVLFPKIFVENHKTNGYWTQGSLPPPPPSPPSQGSCDQLTLLPHMDVDVMQDDLPMVQKETPIQKRNLLHLGAEQPRKIHDCDQRQE